MSDAPALFVSPKASAIRDEFAAVLRLAAPMALANLLQMALYAIDVIFVARLGQPILAASSLGVTIFALQMWCFSSLTGALAPLIAADLGHRQTLDQPDSDDEGDADIRRTMRMALWLAVACGLVGMVVCSFGGAILRFTGQSASLAATADGFLKLLRWAMVPLIAANVLRNYVSAMGRPIFATLITALAILANIAGNYAFVFGHWGVPAMGLRGSALSTCVTALVTLGAYAVTIHADKALHRCRILTGWWRPDWSRLRHLLRIGTPIALTVLAEGGLFSSAAFLMGLLGEAQLAGHTVALQVAAFAFQLPMGIGQAATIRVGFHYGANDRAGVGRAGWLAIVLGLGFSVSSAALMLLAPRFILSAYVDVTAPKNAAMVTFAVRFLSIAAAFQLADGVQAIAAGALRGLRDTRVPMGIALWGYWLGGFVTASLLGFATPLGGTGVWIGLAVGLLIVAVLLLRRWALREALGLQGRYSPEPAEG